MPAFSDMPEANLRVVKGVGDNIVRFWWIVPVLCVVGIDLSPRVRCDIVNVRLLGVVVVLH